MAGLTTPNYLTLADVAKMCHNQELVPMVDEIGKATTLLSDMPWKQASDAMRDVTGKVTAYPEAQWTGLDLGVKASKGDWTQVEEGLAMVESWSEINEKTYNVSPNKEMARWLNDQMHIRALGMKAEKGLIYGNKDINVGEPRGFMSRFTALTNYEGYGTTNTSTKYDYITLGAGGTTANKQSSILLIAGGPMCPTLLYPRYKEDNGLSYRHFDFENAKDELGGNVRVAKSQFQMTFGLSIADTRTAVRIANIETSAASLGGFASVRDKIYEAFAAIPQIYRSSVRIYAPKSVILGLRQKYANIVNPVTYSNGGNSWNAYGDIYFDGMLIRECESMLDTEAVVTAG